MYAHDLLYAIIRNITCGELFKYIAEFLVLTALVCASGLFVVLGRFRGISTFRAVTHLLSLSATVSGLILITFLPWPLYQTSGKIEQQIIQDRLNRFEQMFCCLLDRVATSGEYPFMLYENGQGIVLAGQVDHRYFPMLNEKAKTLLPEIMLEEPKDFLPSEGMICQQQLVHNIVDWNRKELEEALHNEILCDAETYRCTTGTCAAIFFVLLMFLSNRYGRIMAESCVHYDGEL